jgi:hypothetical protein
VSPPPPETPSVDAVAHGRRYLQIALVFLIATDIAVTVAYVVRLGPGRLPQQVVRLMLWLLIAFFILKGKGWARWLLVVLLLGGLMALLPTLTRPNAFAPGERLGTALMAAMYAGYGVVARGLIWSDSVRAFFHAHRKPVAPSDHAT